MMKHPSKQIRDSEEVAALEQFINGEME